MNITLMHYAAPPVVGGVENVMARQAEQFARAGHKVRVLAGRGEKWDPDIPVKIIPILDSRNPEILKVKDSLDHGEIPANYKILLDEIYETLTAELAGADRIIAHNIGSLHKNLPLTEALYRYSQSGTASRLILWHHDFAWNSPRYKNELHNGQPWDLIRTTWNGVTQVVISQARKTELVHLTGINPQKVFVIPGGVDLISFYSCSENVVKLAERLGLFLAEPLLLTPVRITKRKNLELAVSIVSELINHVFPRAQLVITGPLGAHNPSNQKYFDELLNLRNKLNLEKSVHFLAEYHPQGLTDREVAELYRLADVLLLTSQEEGFGIPMLEAGLGRLIPFCSDIPPLRALGQEWANYFSLKDSPFSIANQITQRLNQDSAYNYRKKVRQNYTWEAIYQNQIAPLLSTTS
jgi:mannosylglucosylglycerate synthase